MVVLLCEETCSTGICEINFTVARAARKRLRNCDACTVSLIAVDNVRLTYTQEFMLCHCRTGFRLSYCPRITLLPHISVVNLEIESIENWQSLSYEETFLPNFLILLIFSLYVGLSKWSWLYFLCHLFHLAFSQLFICDIPGAIYISRKIRSNYGWDESNTWI